ncbi:MAG: dipeptidase [Verrucomicrobiota bacterium]|nr:dipeptidase [Limisphaera sp.]MDW8380889.1 dipeptidase [Verrucomicrobiota bacterium]
MRAVLEYLEAHQQQFIEELKAYVRFPTVSAQSRHREDMLRCAQWLVEQLRHLGLQTQLHETAGHPIVLGSTPRRKGRRHFLVYGHYDVQPPEPLELWQTPPFDPSVRGGVLYGRGASDNKGQHWAHVKALEAYLRTGTELPCDLTFLIEGEEEVGGPSLETFLKRHRTRLRCDAVVVSDTGLPGRDLPALTYSLRGLAAFELELIGPNRDLHSGIFGGSVHNPAVVLCQLLGRVHDARGRITIPGFYDDVQPLSRKERQRLRRLPFSERSYRRLVGVSALFGEAGYTPNEQRMARPTFEINGLTSGYQGEGSKTIIPSSAAAKVTMRLVPNQQPQKILQRVEAFLEKHCPRSVRMNFRPGHGCSPYWLDPDHPDAQAALRALRRAFDREPLLLREGGSIPIVNRFKEVLGAETLLLGLALPDDNAHAPNEKFDLEVFARGQHMSAWLWQELATR